MEKAITIHDDFNIQVNYRLIEALSESESRFKNLIEQLNEIVFMLDTSGCFTFINPAWQQHTGYQVAVTIGQPIQKFIHPDDFSHCEQRFLAGENSRFDVRFLDKHGNTLWFEATVKFIQEQQHLKEIFGTFIDITERVKAIEELRISKERFSLAATASNDGIWDWNLLTDEVYFSPRWKEMLGYSDDELENSYSTWYNRIHPDDLQETITSLMSCLEGKNDFYENVHRLKNKNGGWSWILDRGIVMRDKSGQGLRMAGSHADITQLKQIEEELLERQQVLNTIFSMSPDGIVTVTPAGIISFISPSFLSMTGFSSNELMLISESDFTKKMSVLCIQGSPYIIDENEPYTLIQILPIDSQTGSVFTQPHVKALKVTVCKLSNESVSKVMYFRDVTIETEIDRMKSEFLSTAAHELRTPMSSVYGFTELLLTRKFDKSTRQEILRNIHHQSESLVRMINDLLDLAKIEARMDKEFNFSKQPLETIVKQAIAEFMIQGDERVINTAFSDGAHIVYIDADKIKRALTNIISNAFKYSPNGGDVSVMTKLRKHTDGNGEIGVVVKDCGIGMTEQQIAHVFERFWRGSNLTNVVGTGLGMSLVKEIMDFHKGSVEIDSQPGIGTTVSLWFKLSKIEGAE